MSSESKQRPDWVNEIRPGRKGFRFDLMEVGETKVIKRKQTAAKNLNSFRSTIYNAGKRNGKKFQCRQLPNGDYEVYRDE